MLRDPPLPPFYFLSLFFPSLLLNKLETRRLHIVAWNISFECPMLVPSVSIFPEEERSFVFGRDNRLASVRGSEISAPRGAGCLIHHAIFRLLEGYAAFLSIIAPLVTLRCPPRSISYFTPFPTVKL